MVHALEVDQWVVQQEPGLAQAVPPIPLQAVQHTPDEQAAGRQCAGQWGVQRKAVGVERQGGVDAQVLSQASVSEPAAAPMRWVVLVAVAPTHWAVLGQGRQVDPTVHQQAGAVQQVGLPTVLREVAPQKDPQQALHLLAAVVVEQKHLQWPAPQPVLAVGKSLVPLGSVPIGNAHRVTGYTYCSPLGRGSWQYATITLRSFLTALLRLHAPEQQLLVARPPLRVVIVYVHALRDGRRRQGQAPSRH